MSGPGAARAPGAFVLLAILFRGGRKVRIGSRAGVSISNVLDAGVRATANYLRYRAGRWQHLRV